MQGLVPCRVCWHRDEEIEELDKYVCPRCAKDYEFASGLPTCGFCHRPASLSIESQPAGKLLRFPCKNSEEYGNEDGVWAHEDCLLWCPRIYYNPKKKEYEHLVSELRRGKKLQCSHCRRSGATIGCANADCNRTFHYMCAKDHGARLNDSKYEMRCRQCR